MKLRYLYTLCHGVWFTLKYLQFFFWIQIWPTIGVLFVGREAHKNMYLTMYSRIQREGGIAFENWFASLGTARSIKASLGSFWRNMRGGAWLGVGDPAPDFDVVYLNRDGPQTESSLLALGRPNRPLVVVFGSCS